MTASPARGEVWWCELAEIGRRPVVVLSRDAAIPRLRRALVAPCTTTIRALPSEVVLEPGDDPSPARCAVNLDSVEGVSIGVLVERLVGSPMPACGRSAPRSRSPSTANPDAGAHPRPTAAPTARVPRPRVPRPAFARYNNDRVHHGRLTRRRIPADLVYGPHKGSNPDPPHPSARLGVRPGQAPNGGTGPRAPGHPPW